MAPITRAAMPKKNRKKPGVTISTPRRTRPIKIQIHQGPACPHFCRLGPYSNGLVTITSKTYAKRTWLPGARPSSGRRTSGGCPNALVTGWEGRALAHVPGVTERVAARLGPDGEPVRLLAHRDGPDLACRGVDGVDDVLVTPKKPQHLAVGAQVAHVGAAAAGNGPRCDDSVRDEVDDGHAPLAVRGAVHVRGAAVGGVQLRRVPTRVEPVRPDPGRDEADFGEPFTVDEEHTRGLHVGYEEGLAVGRDADVLGHAPLRELEIAEDFPVYEVDLHQASLVLAGKNGEAAVDREVAVVDPGAPRHRERALQRHRLRIAEVEPLQRLGHHDRRAAVGREVHVVGVIRRDGSSRLARRRVDGGQAAVSPSLRIVRYPERPEVPGGDHVLRVQAHGEAIHHLEDVRVNHGDVTGLTVGHVDPRQRAGNGGARLVSLRLTVEIVWVHHRRHPRYRIDGARSLLRRGGTGPGGHSKHESDSETCAHEGTRSSTVHPSAPLVWLPPPTPAKTRQNSDGCQARLHPTHHRWVPDCPGCALFLIDNRSAT